MSYLYFPSPIKKKVVSPFNNNIQKSNFTTFNQMKKSLINIATNTSKSIKLGRSRNYLKTTYTLDTFYSSDTNEENNKTEKKNYSTINNLKHSFKKSKKQYFNNETIKKEIEANKFFKYLKNHFALKEKEKMKVNLYNFTLEKNRKILNEKIKKYKNISIKVDEIKEKSQFLNLVSNYICPVLEREVDKKRYLNKKENQKKKLKNLNERILKERRHISLDLDRKNYMRVTTLYNRKYENLELGLQNLKNKLGIF